MPLHEVLCHTLCNWARSRTPPLGRRSLSIYFVLLLGTQLNPSGGKFATQLQVQQFRDLLHEITEWDQATDEP